MGVIDGANSKALERILTSQPILVDIQPAIKALPNMKDYTILHAAPPISWERMCGPMKGAVIGAILYEGWVDTEEEAIRLAERGEVKFAPCHHYNAVGPMAGIISPSMPVFVVENKPHGNVAYSNMNEGLGRVLRFGAYDEQVISRLKWMEETLVPVLKDAIKKSGGIDLKSIQARALHMGDECHNRNVAGTSLFIREILPYLLETDYDHETLKQVANFLNNNDHFFLNLSMAASKATMDAASHIKYSTIVTVMARNGVDFGIRVSGLGEQWFTAPAPMVKGLYFSGFGPEDANPDLGDSAITETRGLGGFAMAAAPAIVRFVGGTPSDAINYTKEMEQITVGRDGGLTIPISNFSGVPVGIDIRKVLQTGVTPVINTGIAHKKAGVGQVGAGITRAPMEVFKKAIRAFVEKYE